MIQRVSFYLRKVFGFPSPLASETCHPVVAGVCLGADKLHTEYDASADILLAWCGEPRPAINVEVDRDIFVRLDQDGEQVIGIEVIDCAARFHKARTAINNVFAQELLNRYGDRARRMHEDDRATEAELPLFAARR